jgi:hypothetical protein
LTFLDKPSWYGVPVFTSRNFLRYGRSLLILLVLSIVTGLAASYFPTKDGSSEFERFLMVAVVAWTIVFFLAAWFLGVFFWFRTFVNFIQMQRHRTESSKQWSIKRFFIPFYGMRRIDLTDEGVRYRRLAVEGLLGFVGAISLTLFFVFLSQLAGIEW